MKHIVLLLDKSIFHGTEGMGMSANNFTHILQHWFDHNRLPALFVFLIRLPYLGLSHCFKYTSSFYTPEKPDVNPAFRGSTYS